MCCCCYFCYVTSKLRCFRTSDSGYMSKILPLLLANYYFLKSNFVPVHTIKAFGKMWVWFDSFLNPALDGGDWSTSRPSRLIPREGTPSPHMRVIKSVLLDGWEWGKQEVRIEF